MKTAEAVPRFVACQEGHDGCVQLLLSKLANVNLCKKDKAGPLYIACRNRHKSTVQILLQKGADVNALTDTKLNLLEASCVKGFDDIVKILLEGGAKVKALGALFEYSQLPSNDYYSKVEMLLHHDVDINHRAKEGSTFLSYLPTAINSGNDNIVNLLTHYGASGNKDPQHTLYMYVACEEGMAYTAETLLEGGVNMNFLNENGASPL